jgi:16S rRNA (adenine1518-N6/adenine1519-N6)-dimethyltransferase
MPIYKPSELHQFLSDLQTGPKKRLSQNFLIDGNIIRKIVETANVQPGDVVLEIGPGPGSLTEVLLNKGAHVIAVEKDNVLAEALNRLKTPTNQLDVYCDDIMQFPIVETLEKALKDGKKAKVIANLPYNLTTPIIALLIEMRTVITSLHLMVQEEVAQRFVASPACKDYGSFTVFLNFYTVPKYEFLVSRNCFYPVPNVQSAIVKLTLKEPPVVSDVVKFFELTRTAFGQRRKMMRGSLRELYSSDAIMAALSDLNKNPLARPEEMSLADFLQLFEKLQKQ